jgi:ferredoxin/isoprenylcysteine carboxyl methyltransferase (ICMT) family protein YpbQ
MSTRLLGLILFTLLLPMLGQAHHNKGLPHYGYFENYPQVPTEEYVVIDGRWELGATIFNFQGLDRLNSDTPNDAKIYIYAYDLKDDAPYSGPIDFEIRLDGELITEFTRDKPDQENVYRTRETLPSSGTYDLIAKLKGPRSLTRTERSSSVPRTEAGRRRNTGGDADASARIFNALPASGRGAMRSAANARQAPYPATVELSFDIELADEINWLLILGFGFPVLFVFGLALLGRTRRGKARLGKDAPQAPKTTAGFLLAAPAAAPATLANGVDCADPNSVIIALNDGTTATVHIMDGMPPLLFVAGFAAIIVGTFIAVEFVGIKAPSKWRKNLIKKRWIYERLRSRWFQAIPQLIMVVALIGLVYTGLAGSRVRNLMPVAVWTVWWAGLVFMIALVGPMFCFACPWDGLANLGSRLRVAARVETLSLNLKVPALLRTMYPAIVLFVLLSWAELGLGTTTDPRQTAYLGLAMVGLAVTGALLFDGKVFCRSACPVGRISGIYANFAPVEIRARNIKACKSCETEDCLNGNERGYPCPTGISLKTTTDATHCTFCTECIKTCPRYNVAFNLRPFASDLHAGLSPKLDHAWMAIILLALTLFHGLSMTTTWDNPIPGQWSLMRWMSASLGIPKVAAFSLGMFVVMATPVILFWIACKLSAAWTRTAAVSARTIFTKFAFAMLPVALFYHLAHNAMHLLMEGGHVIPMLSDPLGTGADYLGTAGMRIGHIMSEGALWWLQIGLILTGHIFGVLVAHRVARGLFKHAKHATRALIPVTTVMVLVSIAGLTLMVLDMNMRLGRS